MKFRKYAGITAAGLFAGVINGLFGAGGGMILIPMLTKWTNLEDTEVFPSSISIILPICLVSLWVTASQGPLPWVESVPYLIGSALGGILAGLIGNRIPVLWLHRILGCFILYGGIRYLW